MDDSICIQINQAMDILRQYPRRDEAIKRSLRIACRGSRLGKDFCCTLPYISQLLLDIVNFQCLPMSPDDFLQPGTIVF